MAPFDKLHHVCIVAADLDRAQASYEAAGIGPWQAYPPLRDYADLSVPDRAAFFALKYRVCNLPNIQLQLCESDDRPSPQRAFPDSKGEGVFHLGFEVPDADATERTAGLPVLMRDPSGPHGCRPTVPAGNTRTARSCSVGEIQERAVAEGYLIVQVTVTDPQACASMAPG